MNGVLAAMAELPVLSLVFPELSDPGWFVPVLFFRVSVMAIPETEFLVALLGKVVLVVVST